MITESLRAAPWGESVARVLAASLQAVEPAAAVKRHLRREGERLNCSGVTYDLSRFERLLLVGAGKAGVQELHPAAGAANTAGGGIAEPCEVGRVRA